MTTSLNTRWSCLPLSGAGFVDAGTARVMCTQQTLPIRTSCLLDDLHSSELKHWLAETVSGGTATSARFEVTHVIEFSQGNSPFVQIAVGLRDLASLPH